MAVMRRKDHGRNAARPKRLRPDDDLFLRVVKPISLPSRALPFSLDLCLESGQTFAWRRRGSCWVGSIGKNAFSLRQVNGHLDCLASPPSGPAAERLRRY